jgi:hypothetical protein
MVSESNSNSIKEELSLRQRARVTVLESNGYGDTQKDLPGMGGAGGPVTVLSVDT